MARELYSRNWDRMSFDEQKEYRDRKLSYFVRTKLYPYSVFYRQLFDDNKVAPEQIRTVEDLRRLPFTYKSDIAPSADEPTRFRRFVLEPDEQLINEYMPRVSLARLRWARVFKGERYIEQYIWREYGPAHLQFTTGRTGLPTPILYSRNDVERMVEAGRRMMALVGFGSTLPVEEAVVVNAMPFAPHHAFWMAAKMCDSMGVLALHSGGGRALGTRRIITSMESLKATALVGMPGYVYHVLRRAKEEGRDLSTLRLVLLGGDRVPAGMKQRMGEQLESMGAKDCNVLSALGFTEARKAYCECAPEGETGYHLYPDLDYLELVDPESGDPVGEGEDGELVYTCLEGEGTSVVRFRTGDFVKGGITNEPCPECGRKVPRLASDITRSGREKGFSLTKIKGTLVDQGSFLTVLGEHPQVEDWQVEIKKVADDPFEVDQVDIYVTPAPDADTEALQADIDDAILAATEIKPNCVYFVPAEELEDRLIKEGGLKEVRVVDRRKLM